MNDAGRIGRRRRIITTPTIGNFIVRTLSRRKPGTSGIVRRILSVFEPKIEGTGRQKKLMKNSWRRNEHLTVNICDSIQRKMQSISITVERESNRQLDLSLHGNGRSFVSTIIIPVFAVGDESRK
jgi:hypothetical protein